MSPESEKFLGDIRSDDVEVRFAAWSRAGQADPEVIVTLGKLLVAEQPGVRKAADESLKRMVHGVGKEKAGARRAEVVKQLLLLTANGQAEWTRVTALRHLSLIGGDETVPVAATLLRNPEMQEEAIFCIERIPGAVATRALMDAMADASDKFKPRILAALGHRKDEAAIDVCAKAIESTNPDIMMAGLKSTSRIGARPKVNVKSPAYEPLPPWQRIEYTDSALRFADEQVRRGNMEDAVKYYRDFMIRPEEHLQCAAIIGLSKTGNPDAAAMIFQRLKSENRNVRITAQKAWKEMAKG